MASRSPKPTARRHRGPTRAIEIDLGPLPELIGFMLRRAQIAVFREVFPLFAEVAIRPAQFSVLTVIAHNPGLTQSQVSAALGIKRTNFVALIDGLERRGLAKRRPAVADRRSHALHLTGGGRAVLRRLNQLVDTMERRLVARIGETGRDQLLGLLDRLAARRTPDRPKASKRKAAAARRNGRHQVTPNRSLTSRGIG